MNGECPPEVRKINFRELIHLNLVDSAGYSFADYQANDYRHPMVLGYCVDCEQKTIHEAKNDPGFALRNISHGAYSQDFFDALPRDERPDRSNWHDYPVMFVFEAPSNNKM